MDGKFITAFTSARHLSLSYARSLQVHASPSHILKIHFNIVLLNINFNIILPSTHRSSKSSLSLKSHHQTSLFTSPLSHTHYMPGPLHYS